jgi:carbamoyl-phosphate synthase small subunit
MSSHATLQLEDGSAYPGLVFGSLQPVSGEVVFNTGMVGYLEALTDPSYMGQILVLTYPLIGNYGVPPRAAGRLPIRPFESDRIQVSGLIVSEVSHEFSHWAAAGSFGRWLSDERIPVLAGLDTRALTKRLRTSGSMLGKIVTDQEDIPLVDPNRSNLVTRASVREPVVYSGGPTRIVLVDCGCKASIVRSLLGRGVTVVRVPWDYDFLDEDFDAVVVSNGPGDPRMCGPTIAHVRRVLDRNRPVLGICLGPQILALAAGANTYKLKFGHRGQNQPCLEAGTRRCFITSQNHGYAVDARTLPPGWEPWFVNANDGTNEGMRHRTRPFMSVQFHPEAAPGPLDTRHLFDRFLAVVAGSSD